MCSDSGDAFYYTKLECGWTGGRFRPLDELARVVHAVTTRSGPDTALVAEDTASAARQVADVLELREVAFCRQVHSRTILAVEKGGEAGRADGLASNTASLGICGKSADCPIILIADPAGGAVGMAHASWRGTVGRVACELVASLAGRFGADPENMVACICPSAGPCCYQVGRDVLDAAASGIGPHAEKFFASRGGGMYFDLWAANADQLARSGLRPRNVHVAGVCTICENGRFPSHRAEGEAAGRFLAIIARN